MVVKTKDEIIVPSKQIKKKVEQQKEHAEIVELMKVAKMMAESVVTVELS